MFTEQQLLNVLNDILQRHPLVEDDLRRPSGPRVQDTFLRLLIECGCNELLLKPAETRRVLIDVRNPNGEKFPEEMYTDTMPIDTLLVALRWVMRSLSIPNSEAMVTLYDLIEPQAKRNKEILTALANFWLISNQYFEDAEAIMESVKEKQSGFEKNREKVRAKRKQIEEIRKEMVRCKESNTKDSKADKELSSAMGQLQLDVQALNEEKEAKKAVMDEKKRELQIHRDKVEQLDAKIKDMRDELKGGMKLNELRQALHVLIENGNRKNVDIQNFDSERRALEAKIKDLETLVPSLLKSCDQVEQKLVASERELRLLSTDAQLQNNEVLHQQDEKHTQIRQIEEAQAGIAKKQSAWKKKKEMKLADLKALEVELGGKTAKLSAKAKETEKMKKELRNEIKGVQDAMRAESREMKSKYQAALKNFAEDYKILDNKMNVIKKVYEKLVG